MSHNHERIKIREFFMTVHNVTIPKGTDGELALFATFLAQSEELQDQIDTSVRIEVIHPEQPPNSSLPESRNQHVEVREYGNDGYELVAETDEHGAVTGYHAEGTSKVGKFVQDLADDYFGHHNYSCGFYEDEESSRTTITP